ncbi:MAG: T9SS type A sorting domain-containing protein [Prolixibacteraceae bacterium]|nr:T9SS type A sorting domain-containing protein [Prolixibacteraceae bacterium]
MIYGTGQDDILYRAGHFQNSLYLLGTTRKTGQSAADYHLLKIDNTFNISQSKIFGDFHHDTGHDLFINENGVFVFGSSWDKGFLNNDMRLTKINSKGDEVWTNYYGDFHSDQGFGVIQCEDKGFALVGFTKSRDVYGDIYLVKTDEKGEKLWENHFGSRYVDYGFCIVENRQNELIIAGTEGGFFNPTRTDFKNHDADIYIVKTNSMGELIWCETYGGDGHDWAKSIVQAPSGGYYVCGSTQSEGAGSFDVFLMKIDENGNELWKKTYGGANYEYGESVALTSGNSLYIVGTSSSYSNNGEPDLYLIKTDLDGDLLWDKCYGTQYSDYGKDLMCVSDSGCIVAGYTRCGNVGKSDFLLYKVGKDGEVIKVTQYLQNNFVVSVSVYPNPVINHTLFVEIQAYSNFEFDFQVFTMGGRVVWSEKVGSNQVNNLTVNIGSGAYIYHLKYKGKSIHSDKFIVH